MTVTKRNSSPGRARRKPLKPLRREGRIAPATPVVTTVCYFLHTGHGCGGHPAFPAPSLFRGTRLQHQLGARCGLRARRRVFRHSGAMRQHIEPGMTASKYPTSRLQEFRIHLRENAPHSPQSSPAKAGDPVLRDISARSETPRRTGSPAFAGYDGRCKERSSKPNKNPAASTAGFYFFRRKATISAPGSPAATAPRCW